MIHEIHIPNWRPTSANTLLSVHHMEAHRKKMGDMQMIGAYASRAKTPKAPSKRKVEIIIGTVRGKEPDPDAFHKSVHDALKNLRLVIDDNSKWLLLTPNQFVRGKEKFTTIRLTDL